MKESFIKLLHEEYKQTKHFDELEKLGVDMQSLRCNLSGIVFDMVGIPSDNRHAYNFNSHIEGIHNFKGLKLPDDNVFSRDVISEEWSTILHYEGEQVLVLGYEGLKIKDSHVEVVLDKIATFVDWLILESSRFKD